MSSLRLFHKVSWGVHTNKYEARPILSLDFPSLSLYLHPQLNIFCRVTYVIAFLLFLTGAALNNGRGEQRNYFRDYDCYVLKPGVFSFATIVGMASLTLGMSYFLILNSAKNDPSTVWGHPSVPPQPNIAMAQPQFPNPPPPPQRTADPVFVHEDTYMRRQFTWSGNVGWHQMRLRNNRVTHITWLMYLFKPGIEGAQIHWLYRK